MWCQRVLDGQPYYSTVEGSVMMHHGGLVCGNMNH